ncbi:YfcC family protein [Mycetocola spongiae]|uniref:YfcC family protein n=1 Tax=Mycetocola spongiae TaxID=2859226 RepID=UPI001CF532BA|nr:YfcC family protein [Mycetocola spongiae]UCR90217.1 YfcC family protein [Mycetocola spongiae]
MTSTATPPVRSRRKFEFPSAFTVLVIVTLLVWIAVFFIPSGQYEKEADGSPIVGTFQNVPAPQNFGERVIDFFLAPINGLYGILNHETGMIQPFGAGSLFGAVGVFMFVLAIGAFMTVVFQTGAMDRGIARLAFATRKRGWLLIASVMVLFSLLGSTMGFAEETLGFYALIVPLMLALGYDRLVAVGSIFLAAGVGAMASTVNPFSIGVASGEAGVSIGDGIVLRIILWVVLTTITVLYVLRYARKIKANPAASILAGDSAAGAEEPGAAPGIPEALSGRQKAVLVVTGLAFATMIFSVIPWSSVLPVEKDYPFAWELGWWFPELTALFIVGAVVVGFIGGLGEKGIAAAIGKGAGDFIFPAIVILLARGVTVILNNTQTIDTMLHAMEQLVVGASAGFFAVLVFLINAPLAILVPSSSGHATLAMPLLAPLGDFAGIDRSLVITAWNAGARWMGLIMPTNAVLMGGIALAGVGYNKYARFVLPLMAVLLVVTLVFLVIGALL